MSHTILQRFKDIVTGPDENINLAEAALLIAAIEYPELDLDEYLQQVDKLAAEVRSRCGSNKSSEYILDTMNEYLFDELGFSGNLSEFNDPKNSFLNDVLDRKLGIPISLSVLYMEVGKRLGLDIKGVSFPGHFIVKIAVEDDEIVLDPFADGVALDQDELELRLSQFPQDQLGDWDMRHLLSSATNKEILARMLRNLKGVYIDAEDFERALVIISFILLVTPDSVSDIRERAYIYDQLDCFQAAIDDYKRYLVMTPNADDIAVVQARLMELGNSAQNLH